MIEFKSGNIFDSKAHTLVNCVNMVGVMGAGLALQFKKKFPQCFESYVQTCIDHSLSYKWFHFYQDTNHGIWNFPTKKHWAKPSKIEYVHKGLKAFTDNYKECGIVSVAFPQLGCGRGGLDYDDVKPIMIEYLEPLDIPVEIYENK